VVLLAPYLTEATAPELLSAASHKTRSEIERDLAHRFPRPDVPPWVAAIPAAVSTPLTVQQAPGPVETLSSIAPHVAPELAAQAPVPVDGQPSPRPPSLATTPLAPPPACDRQRVMPIAPGRFTVQFTMGQSANDKLQYAQELLSHQLPSGDIGAIFERGLDALIPQLEQAKFAATDLPRLGHRRRSVDHRTIPADVMRAVWERDQGQCTYVSKSGHRCGARKFVEFDHVQEVARGGEASIDGIRLLCHAHNQHQAERTFGADFMRHKRIAAREARAEKRRTAIKNAG
jgi:5-methylcytosine-specific restriction endonuclease McrA